MFPEYSFVATCLKVGLTMNDLKELTYVEVMKILISFIPSEKEKQNEKGIRTKATQKDIDMLLG